MEPSYQRTVVVGVDGSAEALVAARWAVWQATLRGLDLQLVYSYPLPIKDGTVSGSLFDDFADAGQTVLSDARAALEVPATVAVSSLFAQTLPALLMQRLSQSAALVVVGQHAVAWYDRSGRGSVASPLAHHAGCPVVVVPPTWRRRQHERRPVVVALEGGLAAVPALDFAFDEAALLESEVVALHADTGGPPGLSEAAEHNIAELVGRARAGRRATPARVVSARGATPRVVLTAARDAALLVVGAPHTEGLVAWTRSTAHRVMSSVECPMVVVPRHQRRPVVPVLARADMLMAS